MPSKLGPGQPRMEIGQPWRQQYRYGAGVYSGLSGDYGGVDEPGISAGGKRMYTPSRPGYRIAPLNNAIAFDRCVRDRIPCAWCGELLDLHVFDTICPSPPQPELGLTPH
jgi:hypothetical protein